MPIQHNKWRQHWRSGSGDPNNEILSDISTKLESDSERMLRTAQEGFAAGARTTCCGPKSSTLDHWHEPVKTVKPGKSGQKWQFKCKYCNTYVCLMFWALQHELTMF